MTSETNKHVMDRFIAFINTANEKLAEEHGQPDMLGLLQQIGAVPTP